MKPNVVFYLLSAAFMSALTSCERELMTEDEETPAQQAADSKLTITTRADVGSSTVSYPVTVYVMSEAGSCVKSLTLATASDQMAVDLPAATYHVYAVGGASATDYVLPDADGATATTAITLRSGAQHGDLMTASNDVTLKKNENGNLTLSMTRRVMQLQSVTITDIPRTVDAVSVGLTPIANSLLLNGNYSSGSGEQEIQLTRQSDGTTWSLAQPLYMLPATASATVKVRLTTGTENTSYNYSCPQALEANHEVSITGQFVDNSEVRLEGSITGAVWGTPIVVDFTFGTESSTSSSDPVTPSGESAPAVNSLYKDCFVLSAADDASGEYTIVTLLHKNARDIKASDYTSEAALTDAINAALPDFAINGVTGWRLPTHDEMQALQIGYFTVAYSGDADATAMGNNFYYCTSGTDLKAFVPSAVSNILDYSMGERLRPVTTLSFRK